MVRYVLILLLIGISRSALSFELPLKRSLNDGKMNLGLAQSSETQAQGSGPSGAPPSGDPPRGPPPSGDPPRGPPPSGDPPCGPPPSGERPSGPPPSEGGDSNRQKSGPPQGGAGGPPGCSGNQTVTTVQTNQGVTHQGQANQAGQGPDSNRPNILNANNSTL